MNQFRLDTFVRTGRLTQHLKDGVKHIVIGLSGLYVEYREYNYLLPVLTGVLIIFRR